MNSQSRLLSMPYDVRREIYRYLIPSTIHVYLEGGQVRISECLPLPDIDPEDVGAECKEGIYENRDSDFTEVYAKRLMSPWGPHWKCEEHTVDRLNDRGRRNTTVENMKRVCSFMKEEVSDLLARSTEVVMSDFERIHEIMHMIRDGEDEYANLMQMRKLTLIIRVPSAIICECLTPAVWRRAFASDDEDDAEGYIQQPLIMQAWNNFPSLLSHLSKLQNLDIWLDLADNTSWREVPERELIRPLQPLSEIPGLDFHIEMPDQPDEYKYVALPHIRRRHRQKYFGEPRSSMGQWRIVGEIVSYEDWSGPEHCFFLPRPETPIPMTGSVKILKWFDEEES